NNDNDDHPYEKHYRYTVYDLDNPIDANGKGKIHDVEGYLTHDLNSTRMKYKGIGDKKRVVIAEKKDDESKFPTEKLTEIFNNPIWDALPENADKDMIEQFTQTLGIRA